MTDAEDKTAEQLATEINSPQIEQVGTTDEVPQSPAPVPATRDELLLGKFKGVDELASAYQELERNFTASRQHREVPMQQPAAPAQADTIFDNETTSGIRSILKAELEQEKAAEFARRHREELQDPLLRGAVLIEIQEANARNEYIDQETALTNARNALESRLSPKVAEASKESFEEGKNLARRKEQAGAIGSTSAPTPTVDPEALSAADYAVYHGLDRV